MTYNQRVALRRIVAANDEQDNLRAARGIINGLLIVAPFWALFIWAVFAP